MNPTILILVLVSAGLHPLREFFIRGSSITEGAKGGLTPEGIVFAVTIYFVIFSGGHLVVLGVNPLSAIVVWPLALVSGLGIISYHLGILRTLRHGDFSIYYPITRSSPLFVVIVGFFFLGHQYTLTLILGFALVLVGAFLLQYRPGAGFFTQPRTLAVAIFVMCAHGLITLADAEAMKSVEPVAFLFFQYVFLIPAMAILLIITRPTGRTVYRHLFIDWVHAPFKTFILGITSYASYYLILLVFQMGANVAAVASVRQISIPLSVILGGLILKEARMSKRLGWSLLLAAGVILIIFSK